jgi:DNA-binding NtrC family response regulator
MTEDTHVRRKSRRTPGDLALVVHEPAGTALVKLEARRTSIGRDDGNDIVLSDRYVSLRHCEVEESMGQYHVRDLGSRNGTHLNGAPIREGILGPGAQLSVGRTLLLCVESPVGRGPFAGPSGLVGQSAAMLKVEADLARFGPRAAPVLVEGETGTGKELAARALHELSARRQGPFVALNCGALPTDLAMSELFGHERGSFTGAVTEHRGAFEQAARGTLFLDEVGELDPRVQAALLRTLETGRVRRAGGVEERAVDVRLVAATNRDLDRAVEAGLFRLDLFHRLAVLRVRMPPLRERLSDLPDLARSLLAAEGSGSRLREDAIEVLMRHRWPGNVRELKNVLERACALSQGMEITAEDLRFEPVGAQALDADAGLLLAMVTHHGGSIAAAARALGIPRTTLRDRVHRARVIGQG